MQILYKDEHIAVIIKPQGIASEGEGGSAVDRLSAELGAEVFPVHRLDKETGGVMVFALSKNSASVLSEDVREHRIVKKYYAVLKGKPEQNKGELKDLLFRDRQKNKTYVVKRMRKGVKSASLEYEVVEEKDGLSLIDVLLHTGRTHQIRVQFSSRGLPLFGDGRYGGGAGRLALFARSLEFRHPATGENLCFTALPDNQSFPWILFEIQ